MKSINKTTLAADNSMSLSQNYIVNHLIDRTTGLMDQTCRYYCKMFARERERETLDSKKCSIVALIF